MFKKRIVAILVILGLTISAASSFAVESKNITYSSETDVQIVQPAVTVTPVLPTIDASMANSAIVKIKYASAAKLKVIISKDTRQYTYDLIGNDTYQSFPFQLGNGTYKVAVYENIEGTSYRNLISTDVQVAIANPNQKYLTSIQMINWKASMAPIKKAKALTKGLSDKQKLAKVYNYVVKNIKYNKKIKSLPAGYIPNIQTTYRTKKGICYDFASTFASMMRSVGVPTKVVKGTATKVKGYHAWNEVYIGGKWHTIDTATDSQLIAAKRKVSMYKTSGYKKQLEF